jgi:ABC-type amino acid transport substrate-binding protein
MRYIVLIIVFISYLFSSINEIEKSVFTKEELEWIKNNPVVKVGVDEDWPPFDYVDGEGKHNGISSEYLKIISEKTGLKFDIYADSWHKVMEKIKNKELDILACAAKNPEREAFLNFTNPYLSLDIVVVARKDLKLKSFDEIKNYKVAVQKSDYIYDALKKRFPNIDFVFVESNSDALKFVSYGKADLYIDNLPTISYFIEKNLLTNLEIKTKADFDSSELSIAVIKEKSLLKDIIEKVLKNIGIEEKDKIKKKWAFSLDEKNDINFSKEELLWIKNNPVIKIGADANWPPFEYIDSSGKYQGIASDYLYLISKYTGLQFEVDASDWYSTILKIRDKKLDMLACVAKTPDREKYLNFTSPFLNIDIVVIGKKELQINNFDEIKNYKVAVQKGNFVYEKLIKKFPNIEFIFASSNKEAFEFVSYGKADIFIGNMPVFSYFVEKEMLTNLEVKFKADFEKIDLSMAVLKENEILFHIIEKVMPKIVDEEQEKINKKWIFELKEKSKRIDFTKEEIDWLKDNPVIKIAGDPFWPPYSFYDDQGTYIGLIPDLVNEVFKDSNIKVEYVKTNSWSETLNLIKEKKINLIDSISYSPSRSEYLNFSNKYIGAEIVIIANNKEMNYVNSFNNITDKNIATVKGYSIIEEIKQDFPQIKNIKEPLADYKKQPVI